MIKKNVIFIVIAILITTVIIAGCNSNDDIDVTPGNTIRPGRTPSDTVPAETPGTEEPEETEGYQDPGDETETPAPTKTPDVKPMYYIKVNVGSQIVTVYKMDSNGQYTIPYKHFITSTGLPGSDTPLGKFKIYSSRHTWMRMVDNSYGQYAVRFNGAILFHSITYEKKSPDTFKWYEYNKLGYKASLGCVRLRVIDAKWIFDNCVNGTVVEVYEGDPEPELWQKLREQLKAPLPEGTNWDPTDPNPKNPIRLEDLPYPTTKPSTSPYETVLPTEITDTDSGETSTPDPTETLPVQSDTPTSSYTETPSGTEETHSPGVSEQQTQTPDSGETEAKESST